MCHIYNKIIITLTKYLNMDIYYKFIDIRVYRILDLEDSDVNDQN